MTSLARRIQLIQADITTMRTDAIVNAANSSLMGGGGVDGAIHLAAGPAVLKECREYVSRCGRLLPGQAMITSGGKLHSKYIIHTVGPVWDGGNNNEDGVLADAYISSLKIASQHSVHTIAFPNISTGIYHFPKDRAAEIAIEATIQFLESTLSIDKVHFVCFDDENFHCYELHLKKKFYPYMND